MAQESIMAPISNVQSSCVHVCAMIQAQSKVQHQYKAKRGRTCEDDTHVKRSRGACSWSAAQQTPHDSQETMLPKMQVNCIVSEQRQHTHPFPILSLWTHGTSAKPRVDPSTQSRHQAPRFACRVRHATTQEVGISLDQTPSTSRLPPAISSYHLRSASRHPHMDCFGR